MAQEPSQQQPDTVPFPSYTFYRAEKKGASVHAAPGIWVAEPSLNHTPGNAANSVRAAPARPAAAGAPGVERARNGCLRNAHVPPQSFLGLVVRRRPGVGRRRGRNYNSQEAPGRGGARRAGPGRGLTRPLGARARGLGDWRKMAPRRVGCGPRGLRAPPVLLLLLLLLGPWPAAGHGGKYSREKNEPAGEFRMEKLNQLWEKAQRVSAAGAPPPRGARAGTGVRCRPRGADAVAAGSGSSEQTLALAPCPGRREHGSGRCVRSQPLKA